MLFLPLILLALPFEPETGSRPVEAVSLLGQQLERPVLSPDAERRHLAELSEAEAKLAADPDSAEALIWVGRRLGYLGRFNDAIEVFTRGVEQFPEDPRFLRHRGHRYISVRRLDEAISDLSRAATLIDGKADEIEPDGMPNSRNIPTSTLQSNIWYHLGLAHYLAGDLEAALGAYREGMKVSKNPDGVVSMSHWLYMTLRRLGREEEAADVLEGISAGMDVIENQPYHRLLLFYRGDLGEAELVEGDGSTLHDVTVGYGLANWYFYNGDPERAEQMFRAIVDKGEWAAFGSIAAEAELARR